MNLYSLWHSQAVGWTLLILCVLFNTYLLMKERKQNKPIVARVFSLFFCLVILVLTILDDWKI